MFNQTGILRRLGLALVLAIGFGIMYGLAAGWGNGIWEAMHRRNAVYEELVVRADGTPLIRRNSDHDGHQSERLHALDGSEVPGKCSYENALPGASLSMPRGRLMFPLEGKDRIAKFRSAREEPYSLWYFIDDGARDGRGYFVGYDSQSKLCIGFIGRNGSRSGQPRVEEWFPMDGVKLASGTAFAPYNGFWSRGNTGDGLEPWRIDMISGTQLVEVDVRTGSVTTLMESADLIAVAPLATASMSKAEGDDAPQARHHQELAVRTKDRVIVFDPPGKQHAAFPLPEELRDRSIELYELDARRALVTASRMLPDHSSRVKLFWIDASGKVLRWAEVSLDQGDRRFGGRDAWVLALVVPVPVVVAFVAAVVAPQGDLSSGLVPTYAAALARNLAVIWPALLVVTLVSAALAIYCFRRHRRYYQPSSGVWFVFILLLGLPGLVGYLFHRRWPVLEKCPSCGHDVPRDRETCSKCGAMFPAPQRTGCEVFA